MIRSNHFLSRVALLTLVLATPSLAREPSKTTSRESAEESLRVPGGTPTKIPEEAPPEKRPVVAVESITVYGAVITIVDDCEADEVRVTADGVTNTWDSSDLTEINVAMTGDGNWFKYQAGKDTHRLLHRRNIIIQGDDKFDTVDIDLNSNEIGSNGVTVEAAISFNIDTGHGQDTVSLLATNIEAAGTLSVTADLGNNNDSFICSKYGELDGNMNLSIAGGANEDSDFLVMGFNTDIGPNGNLNVFCHGGHDFDWIECRYRGRMEGTADFYVYGNDFFDFEPLPIDLSNPTEQDKWYLLEASAKETDTIIMDIRPAAGSNGLIMATVEDGLGNDDLVLQVVNDEGAAPLVVAKLNGGYGYDYWYATGYDDLPGVEVEVEGVEAFEPSYRQD